MLLHHRWRKGPRLPESKTHGPRTLLENPGAETDRAYRIGSLGSWHGKLLRTRNLSLVIHTQAEAGVTVEPRPQPQTVPVSSNTHTQADAMGDRSIEAAASNGKICDPRPYGVVTPRRGGRVHPEPAIARQLNCTREPAIARQLPAPGLNPGSACRTHEGYDIRWPRESKYAFGG